MSNDQIIMTVGGLLSVLTLLQVVMTLLDRHKRPESQAIETMKYDINQIANALRDGFKEVTAALKLQDDKLEREMKDVHKALSDQNMQMAAQEKVVEFLEGYIKSEKGTFRRVEMDVNAKIKEIEDRLDKRLTGVESSIELVKRKVCETG